MLVRYTPRLNELESWLWNRAHDFSPLAPNGDARASHWHPAVVVHENGERILLVADLPGLEQQDVDITLDRNVLTVRGERKLQPLDEGEHHHVERVHGLFTRAFTLPATVDVESVSAEMKAGVLTITLPKKPETRPRQIKVTT